MIRNSMSVRLWAVILLALGLAALPAFSRLRESLRAGVPPETASPDAAPAASDLDVALKNLEFRNIGPAIMGGRIDDFAVIENTPDTIYVGTAGGGLFKTTNGGTTWTPILDHAVSSSIGALAIAMRAPAVVIFGPGEFAAAAQLRPAGKAPRVVRSFAVAHRCQNGAAADSFRPGKGGRDNHGGGHGRGP